MSVNSPVGTNRLGIIVCLTCILAGVPVFTLAHGHAAEIPVRIDDNEQITRVFTVKAHRPLFEAAVKLFNDYGMLVTYEDPRYLFTGDFEDVTSAIRKGAELDHKGDGLRVLVPRLASVSVKIKVLAGSGKPADPDAVLADLIQSNDINRNPGRFEIIKSKNVWHIVPKEIMDQNGKWIKVSSVLETKITMNSGAESSDAILGQIIHQVSKETNLSIREGILPLNALRRQTVVVSANQEQAHDVLINLLENLDGRLAWHILYDHTVDAWYFSMQIGPSVVESTTTTQPVR